MIAEERIDEALQEALTRYLEPQSQSHDRWEITDMGRADWALRKIEKARKNVRQAEATALAEITNIQQWLQDFRSEQQQTIDYFEGLLRPFAQRELEGSKKRSLKLPKGTLGFRKAKETYNRDDDALLHWAEINAPAWVKVKKEPDWTAIKAACIVAGNKLVTGDGEIVEGVTVGTPSDDIFYTKTEEKESD